MSGYEPSWDTTTKHNGLERRSTRLRTTPANSVDSETREAWAIPTGQGVDAHGHVQQPLVAAIDGGGTKTLFLLATADGTVIGIGRGGPLNALFVSPDEAIRSVQQAATGALREAGMERGDVALLYASAPGASRDIVSAGIDGLVLPARLETAGDEMAVLTGALVDEPGVVVLAGTGSFAVGRGRRRDCDSQAGDASRRRVATRHRIVTRGGWGPLLGDEGSAYAIGLAALRAVALAFDSRGEHTCLCDMALEHFSAPRAWSLATMPMSREQIASFAVRVSEASAAGDSVASEILAQAGRDLGRLGVSVLRELAERSATGEPVEAEAEPESESGVGYGRRTLAVLTGGVSRAAARLVEAFRDEISSFSPDVQIVPPQYSPAGGALLMALEIAGLRAFGTVPAGMRASAEARSELRA